MASGPPAWVAAKAANCSAAPAASPSPVAAMRYCAPQTVPAGLLIGTPTALPYSVQEPSYWRTW